MGKTKKKPVRALGLGEAKPSSRLVARTMALLEAHDARQAESVLAIGQHILRTYFGGKLELAQARNPYKSKSYALLAERAAQETSWDAGALRRAVDAACVHRTLPAAIKKELKPGWYSRLAGLDDPEKRLEVAKKIATGELAGVAARREIARVGRDEAGGGRRVQPEAERALGAVERALASAGEDAFDDESLEEIDDKEALAARYLAASRALAELARRLRG